jgi:hypothetical protein
MFNVSVTLDTSFFKTREALQVLDAGGLPNTLKAVNDSLDHVQSSWQNLATGMFEFSTGEYVRGIIIDRPAPEMSIGNEIVGKVVNVVPYAGALEYGVTSEERMRVLYTSHQARISKDGHRYLIIPFRHGTPGTVSMKPMPQHIYDQAKHLQPSKILGTYLETSHQLADMTRNEWNTFRTKGSLPHWKPPRAEQNGLPMAQRWAYQWGQKLKGVGGHFEGMYKFGSAGHTQYITFRVMSENGTPWKGIPAMHLAQKTHDQTRAQVYKNIKDAYSQDVKDILKAAMNG